MGADSSGPPKRTLEFPTERTARGPRVGTLETQLLPWGFLESLTKNPQLTEKIGVYSGSDLSGGKKKGSVGRAASVEAGLVRGGHHSGCSAHRYRWSADG